MQITNVFTQDVYDGIPLKRWSSVVAAISTFANGPNYRQNNLKPTVGQNDQDTYLVRPYTGGQSQFVQNLLATAIASILHRDLWIKDYDYDGPSMFHKTTLRIAYLDPQDDIYLLSISKARLNTAESDLATALCVPLALARVAITAQIAQSDPHYFALDYQALLQKLSSVLPVSSLTGTELLSTLQTISGAEDMTRMTVPICKIGNIAITVTPIGIENRFLWGEGHPQDTWTFADSVLTGLQKHSRWDTTPPSFELNLSHESQRGTYHPFYKLNEVQQVLELSKQIATALKN